MRAGFPCAASMVNPSTLHRKINVPYIEIARLNSDTNAEAIAALILAVIGGPCMRPWNTAAIDAIQYMI